MPRLFVAAWPPPAVLDVVADLPRDDRPGVRWTTRDQWHVTLRFLGAVDEAVAVATFSELSARSTVAILGPTVELLGDTVLMAPVVGVAEVAAAVRIATAAIGEHDERPYRGHVTVARRRGPGPMPLVGHPIHATFAVTELALVRSELHPGGARYTTVTTRPLTA